MPIEGTSEVRTGRFCFGVVGDRRDAFVGGVNRIASRIDNHFEMVAGGFSSTAEKSQAWCAYLCLDSYAEAALAIRAARFGGPTPPEVHYRDIRDGLVGTAFVDSCVKSPARHAAWIQLNI